MTPEELLADLNNAQKTAVAHQNGPLLVIAGAGTGKTTVIARRVAWLVASGRASPEGILALSFTDKSAGEMEDRVLRLLPYGTPDLWIQTFHSFGERVLRAHGLDIGLSTSFRLLSRTEQWLFLRRHLNELKLDYYRPLGNPTKFLEALVTHFSRADDELVSPEEYLDFVRDCQLSADSADIPAEEVKRLSELADAFHFYKRELREQNALDFGDLINETLRLFRTRPAILARYQKIFSCILVDEFQDTNWAQYELVKLLAGAQRNITVVGDDDQSIYKFRGASVSNILDFERDFPDCSRVVLTENYRSRQEILDFAYAFIQHNNPDRLEAAADGISKKLLAKNKGLSEVTHLHGKTLSDEARLVVRRIQYLKEKDVETSWSDFAVLVRANDHAEPFLAELAAAGIPHEFVAARGLYRKPLVLDILAYLRLLDNYHESRALYRVLTSPVVNIEVADLINLTHHADKKSWSLYETVRHAQTLPAIKPESLTELSRLLGLIDAHTTLARAKPVSSVILAFLDESKYLRHLSSQKDEGVARENMRILNYFWREVEKFVREEAEPTVKHFVERIDLALLAGDSGTLPIDPESGPDLLKVMTIHAAKGLEFRHVFLVNLVDKRFPTIERADPIPLPDAFVKERLPGGDAHLEEERRLFYVGCTRAKETLTLTSAEDYGGSRKKKPSIFLAEADILADKISETEPQVFIRPPTARPSAEVLPIPERMSFSQFEAYRRCPLQYKYEHIYRIPKVGNANKSFGQSVHNTLQELLARYLERQAAAQPSLFDARLAGTTADLPAEAGAKADTLRLLVPENELLQIYREKWIDDWYLSAADKEERFKKGEQAVLNYWKSLADRRLEIAGLEVGFNLKFEGFAVKGRIDRIDRLPDGAVEIIDYKTGRAKEKPDRSQLMIYQLAASRALGLTPGKCTYVYLEEGTGVSFLAAPEEMEKFETELAATAAAIRASGFAPTPGKDVCKFCDFKNICESAAR
ncbi:PD-(D/E)XK nuclease family protein [Patescibacteria group bacterium]|nr:MAG: PD-(D/E)XK nuclease family protein [Patescibacteria group bacterium]